VAISLCDCVKDIPQKNKLQGLYRDLRGGGVFSTAVVFGLMVPLRIKELCREKSSPQIDPDADIHAELLYHL
jgi:hypothetical protein